MDLVGDWEWVLWLSMFRQKNSYLPTKNFKFYFSGSLFFKVLLLHSFISAFWQYIWFINSIEILSYFQGFFMSSFRMNRFFIFTILFTNLSIFSQNNNWQNEINLLMDQGKYEAVISKLELLLNDKEKGENVKYILGKSYQNLAQHQKQVPSITTA